MLLIHFCQKDDAAVKTLLSDDAPLSPWNVFMVDVCCAVSDGNSAAYIYLGQNIAY